MDQIREETTAEAPEVKVKRWKRGDVHPETGRLFWQYAKKSKNGEQWVPKETFDRWKSDYAAKASEKNHEKDPVEKRRKRRAAYLKNMEREKKKMREYRQNNLERVREINKKYAKDNKTTIREKIKIRRKRDPLFAMRCNIRIRVWQAINEFGYTEKSQVFGMLGCDWATFKTHLESKFKEGMSWENRNEWDLDHIIPLSSGRNAEEVMLLSHYTNIQVLWPLENRVKGSKMPNEL